MMPMYLNKDEMYQSRYECMVSEQVPPHVIAEWLTDPRFKAFVAEKRMEIDNARYVDNLVAGKPPSCGSGGNTPPAMYCH